MQRFRSVARLTIILCVLSLFVPFAHQSVYAETNVPLATINVSGTISTNTTWTTGNIYVVTGNVTLASNTVLTIQPGVVIKFNLGFQMTVNGVLNAQGTAANPIVFTSYRDDTAGGDTNGDGNATSPARGDWVYITFSSGSTATLNYTQIRYGGRTGYTARTMLDVSGGTLSMTNSLVSHSATRGLASFYGVSSLNISNTVFEQNAGSAAFINLETLATWQLTNNTCVNNGANLMWLTGNIISSTNLNHPGCILGIDTLVTVNAGKVFTLQPNTIVKFDLGARIMVNGVLNAQGTAANPIVFTSYRDDTAGGDTNGDANATSPTRGDWVYITFSSGSTATLNYTQIRYGGRTGYTARTMLDVSGGTLSMTNSLVSHSATRGLASFYGVSSLNISNTVFEQNAGSAAFINLETLATWQLTNNTCVNNTSNLIWLNGDISTSTTLNHPGCILGISSLVTVNAGKVFTLQPNTIVKFDLDANLNIDGTFNALGTTTQPITFTSFRDDSVGGDTNGDGNATSPARGDWDYIWLDSTSTTRLSHTTIRYGGKYDAIVYGSSGSNIVLDTVTIEESATDGFNGSVGTARVVNSVFRQNEQDGMDIQGVGNAGDFVIQNTRFETSKEQGLEISGGRVTMSCLEVTNNDNGGILVDTSNPALVTLLRSSISNNGQYGLSRSGSSSMNAQNLWWGHASGPGGVGSGSGNAVLGNVTFSPWRTSAPDCAGNIDQQQPYLKINYPTGLQGSHLTIIGYNFAISSTVAITVNNYFLGTVPTDGQGRFEVVFTTVNADAGLYTVVATSRAALRSQRIKLNESADIQFNLITSALNRPRESEPSVTTFALPAGLNTFKLFIPLVIR